MFAAEFPEPSKVLPKNSRGDLAPAVTVKSDTLGLISIRSVFLSPLTN